MNGLRRLEAADGGHLWTVLIAAEDTCLSLFSGASAAAVAKANGQAGFAFSRIVETLAFPG